MIRSAIEYSSVVYGGFLTQEQSDELERLQATCLKIIWGWHYSYRRVLQISGLQTLEKRRDDAFKKFTLKAFQSTRFRDRWFPLRERDEHGLRRRRPFLETRQRHDRLQRAPINRMRRLVNDLAERGELPGQLDQATAMQ